MLERFGTDGIDLRTATALFERGRVDAADVLAIADRLLGERREPRALWILATLSPSESRDEVRAWAGRALVELGSTDPDARECERIEWRELCRSICAGTIDPSTGALIAAKLIRWGERGTPEQREFVRLNLDLEIACGALDWASEAERLDAREVREVEARIRAHARRYLELDETDSV